MLTEVIPGIPATEGMRRYFSRFSDRPQDAAFQAIFDEQLGLVCQIAGAEDNAKAIVASAGALPRLFGIASNRWGI
eukprot:4017000-Alexandrium_andersonii.AAC.1